MPKNQIEVHNAVPSFLKKSVLEKAVAVAMASDAPIKMGAILLSKKNRVISAGVNSYVRTHPVQNWAAKNAAKIFNEPGLGKKIFGHAEIISLIKAKEDADTIVVCRLGGPGKKQLSMSRPCKICTHYILNYSKVIHVHYSTPDGFLYEYWGG
jgi:deoxycytidylate deaminase